MIDGLRRNGGLFGGIVVAALIGGFSASWMIGARGVPGPLLLLGGEVGGGAPLAALAILLLLTLVAVVVARLCNAAVALFVLGCGLAVLAMRSGGAVDLAFGGVAPARIGMETIAWAAAVGVSTLAIFRFGGMLPDVHAEGSPMGSAFSKQALVACAAGVLAVPVALVVFRNDLKGQAIAAATIAGMVVGTAGRLWSPRTQPILLVSAAILALGVAQMVMARLLPGAMDVSFVKNVVPRLLLAAPIDLAAGAAAGVGMGLGWAKSFMREQKAGTGGAAGESLRRSTAAGRLA